MRGLLLGRREWLERKSRRSVAGKWDRAGAWATQKSYTCIFGALESLGEFDVREWGASLAVHKASKDGTDTRTHGHTLERRKPAGGRQEVGSLRQSPDPLWDIQDTLLLTPGPLLLAQPEKLACPGGT